MTTPIHFSVGERASNPAKPEWGTGIITSVAAHTVNGKQGQRLRIRFDGAGLKTISTALIALKPAADAPTEDLIAGLVGLPSRLTDRSRSDAERLGDAVAWYRFRRGERETLDWAIQRTGLADPLSIIGRIQTEEAREGFFRRLDHFLSELARDLARSDPESFRRIAESAPPAARSLLRTNTRR